MDNPHQSIRLAKDQPILRRRRPMNHRATTVDLETIQRNFWRHFDLEKFANDWRQGVGKASAA